MIKYSKADVETKMDVGQIKNRLENQAHVEIWKLYYHGKSKTLYYEKSNIFAHLKIANLIVLADPQLLKVQGIDVVKFNQALFEILFKTTLIRCYLWHNYLLNETT